MPLPTPELLPYTQDDDIWPERHLSHGYQVQVPVSYGSQDDGADPPLPALVPLTDAASQAFWGQVESDAALVATGHSMALPVACCYEADDIFEDLPLVPSTVVEDCMQIADTSGQEYQQFASLRSDGQGHFTIKPQDSVTSNLCLARRPHPVPTQVDLLMQVLEESFKSSTNDDNSPVPDGHDRIRKHFCEFPACNKSFRQRAHLKTHERSHTGEKPFLCRIPGCGSAFAQRGNLKTHESRHRGEKPRRQTRLDRACYSPTKRYLCRLDHCRQVDAGKGKAFSQLGSLKKHMNKFHSDTLARLHANFTDQGRPLSQDELELRDYFRSLYRKYNKKTNGTLSLSERNDQV